MFRAETVFVLGAGASCEAGMPIGEQLLQDVIERTNISFELGRQNRGDVVVSQALKQIIGEAESVEIFNDHVRSGWQLAESAQQALSIDNLIEALEDEKIELIAKVGIVRSILEKERNGSLYKFDYRNQIRQTFEELKPSWYNYLFQVLHENVSTSSIQKIFENVSFIDFNYDRCLLQYLSFALSKYYGVDIEEARNITGGLRLAKPYGSAGVLPWLKKPGPRADYGASSAGIVADTARAIKTFSEQVDDGDEMDFIRGLIAGAKRIIFLGFAYHRQNIELIRSGVRTDAEILGTAFGLSESDRQVITSELGRNFGIKAGSGRINLVDKKCADFFKEFRRKLSTE